MAAGFVIGLDAGGTWLRGRAVSLDGAVLARRRVLAGRWEQGVDVVSAVAALVDDLRSSTGGVLVGGVGSNGARVADGWRASGAHGAMFTTMSEAVLAVPPADPNGVVLIAGTGAVAATVVDGVEVSVTGSPRGAGSGVELGINVLAAMERSAQVAAAVRDLVGGRGFGQLSAQEVARCAEVASLCAASGDDVAAGLCAGSAAALFDLLRRHDSSAQHVTLVGSLTDPANPVGAGLVARLDAADISWFRVGDLDGGAAAWALALRRRVR